jgi:hypothetical protein
VKKCVDLCSGDVSSPVAGEDAGATAFLYFGAVSRLRRPFLSDRIPSTAAQDGERKSNRFFVTVRQLKGRRFPLPGDGPA